MLPAVDRRCRCRHAPAAAGSSRCLACRGEIGVAGLSAEQKAKLSTGDATVFIKPRGELIRNRPRRGAGGGALRERARRWRVALPTLPPPRAATVGSTLAPAPERARRRPMLRATRAEAGQAASARLNSLAWHRRPRLSPAAESAGGRRGGEEEEEWGAGAEAGAERERGRGGGEEEGEEEGERRARRRAAKEEEAEARRRRRPRAARRKRHLRRRGTELVCARSRTRRPRWLPTPSRPSPSPPTPRHRRRSSSSVPRR